jgi:hypothetical protein
VPDMRLEILSYSSPMLIIACLILASPGSRRA